MSAKLILPLNTESNTYEYADCQITQFFAVLPILFYYILKLYIQCVPAFLFPIIYDLL